MQDSVLPRGVGLRKPHISPSISPSISPHIFSTLAVLRVALFSVFCVFCGFFSTCCPFSVCSVVSFSHAVLRRHFFYHGVTKALDTGGGVVVHFRFIADFEFRFIADFLDKSQRREE